jgi:hypothetical protein
MFETLQSHDLGCGEGGGRSGADVFKVRTYVSLVNHTINANLICTIPNQSGRACDIDIICLK